MAIDGFKVIVLKSTEEKVNKDLIEKYKEGYSICGDVVVKVLPDGKIMTYIPMKVYELNVDCEKTKEGYIIGN